MAQQHGEARQQVDRRHSRHQRAGHTGDPPDAAQDHQQGESRRHSAHGMGGNTAPQHLRDGVGLGHVSHAQGGRQREHGEERGQELSAAPLQAEAHGVHGTAPELAPAVPLTVLHRQQALRALGGQTQQGGELHPHQGAGAPGHQGRGHAGDVAGADGGGEGRHQGGEGGDPVCSALPGLPAENAPQRPPQVPPGEKAGAEQKKYAGARQKRQHPGAPDQPVGICDPVRERHESSSFPVCDTLSIRRRAAQHAKKAGAPGKGARDGGCGKAFSSPCAGPGRRRWSVPACTLCRR